MSTTYYENENHDYHRTDNNFSEFDSENKKNLYIFYWIISIFGVLLFLQTSLIIYFFRNNLIYFFDKYCNIFRRCKRDKIIIEMGKMSHELKDNE